MNTEQMLTLAAKAAGIDIEWFESTRVPGEGAALVNGSFWDPIKDNDDALSLAMKLRMNLDIREDGCIVRLAGVRMSEVMMPPSQRPRAVRLAIVRAAINIAKG